jgi:hypothetical protein
MEIDVTPNPASGRLICRSLWVGEGSGLDYHRPSRSTRPADFVSEQLRLRPVVLKVHQGR